MVNVTAGHYIKEQLHHLFCNKNNAIHPHFALLCSAPSIWWRIDDLTDAPPAGEELAPPSEIGSSGFLRATCFGAYSHCKCFLCMWEHSDARLMLSPIAIPAAHIFLKTVFDTSLWTMMVQQHTWQLLLSGSNKLYQHGLFFLQQYKLYLCICPMVTWDLESVVILIHNMSRGRRCWIKS